MAVRASDRVTLAVLPAPTYVRTYYLLQSSSLTAPAAPTTNPPAAPWTTTEPGYTAGDTNTLYTVQLVAYGSAAFEYGEVQKSSAYEAAKQAYNLATQAKDAAVTADGRLAVSSSAPTAADAVGKPNGAVWFRRDASNRFNGAWELVNGAWVARTIENAMIATLDAAKINTGYLDVANRVRANAISVQQLLVGSLTNMLEDPSFDIDVPTNAPLTTAWASIHANVTRVTAGARSGPGALRMKAGTAAYDGIRQKNAIHVEPGEEYRFGGWVRRESAASVTGAIEFSIMYGATDATTTTVTAVAASPAGLGETYVRVAGTWKVPAGVYFARPRLVMRADTGNTNTYLVDDAFFQRRMEGELIVDGVITTPKLDVAEIWGNEAWLNVLRAGLIETSMLSAGFGQNLDISANGAITLIAGQVSDQAAELSTQRSDIDGVTDQVSSLGGQVGEVRSSASAAAVAAAAAQAAAREAQDKADGLAAYVRITGEGLEVGSPGAATAVKITPSNMTFNVNGVPGAYLDAGQFIAPRFVGEEVDLANVKIQKQGTRTVVKAI
ncbi:carbohydrate binding domain-containing protein [Microbacterium sp. H37-C3]|uniref:carbohydrate binding domain-containing protein n=1 Tax=Microbacterium sp. H37-C3 TaxID=3004354 RepID=UPI0022B04298|nr:carbohydrate binding domain-containing protein [Microbacterium sp. H37-C3]MCZ4066422.1 carbohydrate binding domain-containing protein [Microbacterium sp. H37-C3]